MKGGLKSVLMNTADGAEWIHCALCRKVYSKSENKSNEGRQKVFEDNCEAKFTSNKIQVYDLIQATYVSCHTGLQYHNALEWLLVLVIVSTNHT